MAMSSTAGSVAESRQRLAQQIQEQREDEVLELSTVPATHYAENAFSLVTGNMAIVSLVLGGVYMTRSSEKPLASFLVVLGLLAPCAACMLILIRQWFYLHLRIFNIVTLGVIALSIGYVAWLFMGQQWAFASSSANCDGDLSTATNVVVFVLYVMLLLYVAKVAWYLVVRVRYSYSQLCVSCFRDPYLNALLMSELELNSLENDLQATGSTALDTGGTTLPALGKTRRDKKQMLLQDMQRHQHEIRQSLHRVFHSRKPTGKVTPRAKPTKAKTKGKASTINKTDAGKPMHQE